MLVAGRKPRWKELLVLRVPVAMVVTLRSMGAHSWQCGGQSNSSLRFVPGKGSGLKCSPADQSTLLVCTMLSSRGWMSPLLPPGMIKVSVSLKVTFSTSLQECGILGLFFFPWKAEHFRVYGAGHGVCLTPMCW